MGKIIQSILHDLASPISSLKGALLLLSEDVESEKAEFLERAAASIEQIIKIIDTGYILMNRNTLRIKFSPNQSINSIITLIRHRSNRAQISIYSSINEDVVLKGMPGLFERIVLNILMNAIEELESSKKDPKLINILGYVEKDKFILTIQDNGRGIKKGSLYKLFLLNFTTKNQKHEGLGLYFTKCSIKEHFEGDIKIDSCPGEYTKVKLIFKIF